MGLIPQYYLYVFLPDCTEDAFVELQSGFMENHYHHFEDKDENKFIYTDIFKKHV